MKIAVVGGGLAGLAAADALIDRGHDVEVIEARRRPGGRAGSFADPADPNRQVDYCQHVAMGCCTALLELLRRSGQIDHWQRYRQLNFYHPATGISRFKPSRWLPAPLHLVPPVLVMRYLDVAQKRRLAATMLRLMRTPAATLVDVSAGQWLTRHGQDDVIRRRFWDVILVSALGERTEVVSMAAARKVIVDGFAAHRDAADVWVPRRPLSQLFGQRMRAWLTKRGVRFQTQTPVRSIDPCDRGVELRTGRGDRLNVDAVVLAVPWVAATKLLDAAGIATTPPRQGETLRSSPITGLHLWFDRPLTDLPHVVFVDAVIHWLFADPLGGQGDRAEPPEHYYQVVISGSHDLADRPEELLKKVLGELSVAFAGVDAVLRRHKLVTDPHSVFSVTPAGQRRRPGAVTSDRRVVLAGDWVRTGWPATMEGAVRSGQIAAAALGPPGGRRPVDLPAGSLARLLIDQSDR